MKKILRLFEIIARLANKTIKTWKKINNGYKSWQKKFEALDFR